MSIANLFIPNKYNIHCDSLTASNIKGHIDIDVSDISANSAYIDYANTLHIDTQSISGENIETTTLRVNDLLSVDNLQVDTIAQVDTMNSDKIIAETISGETVKGWTFQIRDDIFANRITATGKTILQGLDASGIINLAIVNSEDIHSSGNILADGNLTSSNDITSSNNIIAGNLISGQQLSIGNNVVVSGNTQSGTFSADNLISTPNLSVSANTSNIIQSAGYIEIGSNANIQFKCDATNDILIRGEGFNYVNLDVPYLKFSRDNGSRLNMLGGFSTSTTQINGSNVETIISGAVGNTQTNLVYTNFGNYSGTKLYLPFEGAAEQYGNIMFYYRKSGSQTEPMTFYAWDSAGGTILNHPGDTNYQITVKDTNGNITQQDSYNIYPGKAIQIYAMTWDFTNIKFMIVE